MQSPITQDSISCVPHKSSNQKVARAFAVPLSKQANPLHSSQHLLSYLCLTDPSGHQASKISVIAIQDSQTGFSVRPPPLLFWTEALQAPYRHCSPPWQAFDSPTASLALENQTHKITHASLDLRCNFTF